MKRKVLLILAALPAVALTFGQTAVVKAATAADTSKAGQAIVVSPYLSDTRILPTDASKDVSINLTNNTAKQQTFTVSALDFGSLNDSGGLVFAGSNANKLVSKYGLATWLHLPNDRITLAAGESTKLQATIANEAALGPGGHYAAIIMTVDNPPGSAGDTVSVQQKISALIFATKVGGEVYDMRLDKIQTDGNWRRLPAIITLSFRNTGNVHVVPRGTVKLISPSGHVVRSGVINEASSYVLPETVRQIAVQTRPVGNYGWEPGTYKLQVDYRYDGFARFAGKSMVLKYYNPVEIVLIILGFAAIIFAGYKLWQWRRNRLKHQV